MVSGMGATHSGDDVASNEKDQAVLVRTKTVEVVVGRSDASADNETHSGRSSLVPLRMKLISVLLVTAVGFGSYWSSGVTGAMETTLKKQLHINNAQYAVLEASQDFMVTALILVSGLVTDRIGGAIQSFGDIATQVAQYKVFSSWFAPSKGFASTLGFELGIGKIGSFVGKATANMIAKKTGDFSWVYWTAVFMNLFTNVVTVVFWFFTRWCMLLSMCLAAWGPTIGGTAASFGIYAVASSFGPTVIIDSIRTSMRYQEVFGSGYSIKIAVNNSMNIIVRIITGVIQDRDNDSYDNVVVVYVVLAAGSVVVASALFGCSFWHMDAMILQWTKKQRSRKGDLINERKEASESGTDGLRNKKVGMILFGSVLVLTAGAWTAYFWGVATSNND
ncbi:hypothetical protein EK21DRAFT_90351 [Setomelanomma holmii]|uniref:Uncharacterized protein n=1 Tax=Setomelanomma holmii TaxID=210430 RepID=A0A9P4H7X6_9PLEO|nr:hypothetical protein EK21DRAFT_90351 [Setomelanomma holmii]